MPLYRYECRCGHAVEQLEPMRAEGKTRRTVKCPKCRKRARRVISAPGAIIFKGTRA